MPGGAPRLLGVVSRRLLRAGIEARFGLASRERRRGAVAEQFRLACEDLGPSFIKIGQIMSVRPDVFPAELVFELERLRDKVPPAGETEIRRVIRGEFGRPPERLFASFDPVPMASASIAQVHRATLASEARPAWGDPLPAGARVVVKVIRPGVEEAILRDLASGRRFLSLVKRFGLLSRIDVGRLLAQFEESARRELDMRVEGRAADRFAFNFRGERQVVVPRVVWRRTTRRVLTMEYMEGWPLSDLDAARAHGVDARRLAVEGASAFMSQVLVHGLFHADLHHANLFATPDSRIAYLDFGIFGTLTPEEREAVAHLLASLVYRDAERALAYSSRLGVNIRPGRLEQVKAELGALMDRTLTGEGGEDGPDVKHFGIGFMSLLNRHGVDIPVGYGLLVKALVTVEGVSRSLYPDINIMEVAKPFVTRLLGNGLLRPDRMRKRLPLALRAALRELLA